MILIMIEVAGAPAFVKKAESDFLSREKEQ